MARQDGGKDPDNDVGTIDREIAEAGAALVDAVSREPVPERILALARRLNAALNARKSRRLH